MTNHSISKEINGVTKSTASHGHLRLITMLRLTFITGPKVLITSRISGKCAALMLMLCSPSLLFWSVLTIPAFLFQEPQQNAYYYFSLVLNQDPGRWFVMLLAGTCAVLSLAIPATQPAPPASDGFYY
jgi:hypothetical protein